MKTLSEVIRATEMRKAKAIIKMARGSSKLKDCFMIMAIPGSATKITWTVA
jgi:hypothetical protein